MIKRILIILLLFPCLAWAGFSVDGVTDPASVDGVAEPASVGGVDSDYGGETCANAVVVPTSDGTITSWTPSAGSDDYLMIDDGRAGDGDATYIYSANDSNPIVEEIVFDISSPGDCDIAAITVYVKCSEIAGAANYSVYIKADAGAYTSAETITCPEGGSTSEQTAVFTGLSYTTPQAVTVKVENDATTYANGLIDALTIEVTP